MQTRKVVVDSLLDSVHTCICSCVRGGCVCVCAWWVCLCVCVYLCVRVLAAREVSEAVTGLSGEKRMTGYSKAQ